MEIEVKVQERTVTPSSCDVSVGNVDLTFRLTPNGDVRKVASARWSRPATYVSDPLFYEARRQAKNAIRSRCNEKRYPNRTSEFASDEDRVKLALTWGRKYAEHFEPYQQITEWLVSIGRWTLEREKQMLSIHGQMGSRGAAKTRARTKKRKLAEAEAARQVTFDFGGDGQ